MMPALRTALARLSWSTISKCTIKTTFLNIESMSIFNKGVIIRELKNEEMWEV